LYLNQCLSPKGKGGGSICFPRLKKRRKKKPSDYEKKVEDMSSDRTGYVSQNKTVATGAWGTRWMEGGGAVLSLV